MKKYIFIILFFAAFVQQIFSQQFKVATLNCEWLSCDDMGPSDEPLQLNNIAQVIININADIVALQEVGTSASYKTVDLLVNRLNQLGNGWAGAIAPSSNSNCAQNQAIIYKTSKVQSISYLLMSNGGSAVNWNYNWSSGRFPALYEVNFLTNDGAVPVSVINIHAKASTGYSDHLEDYARRKAASEGLKALLDGNNYKNKRIILIGDYNDYLIGTQCGECSTNNSPYKNFMDDTPNYKGLTQNVNNGRLIDNMVISNELFDNYVANSAARITATGVSNYQSTTSDHYPIIALLQFGNYSAVDEIEAAPEISIYPNPTADELVISGQWSVLSDVQIFDITGKLIYNLQFTIYNSINVSALSQGIYLLRINTDKGIFTKKFIKM
ncbi:MAG: T9SS type A sorting domain-containing protein [Prevotellaceae bacterium]|jgi:endonuclease/exonuclease/phosphatase family metal-dependent hydrolase|nr:T9SS type A sorting domain-containing protein [Prevotellaceae bacterium]